MQTTTRNGGRYWIVAALTGFCLWLAAGTTLATDFYVDLDWTGTEAGTQTQPYRTISNAVVAANNSTLGTPTSPARHVVRIAAGTYKDVANGGLEDFSEPANTNYPTPVTGGGYKLGDSLGGTYDRARVVDIFGGYAGWQGGSSFDWTEGSRVPRSTIIDLQGANSRAFYNNHGTHAVTGPLFDGLTIINGNVTNSGSGGAAIQCTGGYQMTMFINNCSLSNNVATNAGYGGAVMLGGRNDAGYVRNSEFVNNRATYGGAAYSDNFSQCSNTVFRGNQATVGGAFCLDQKPGANVIIGCTFENNQASGNGGAFYGRHPQTGPYVIKSSIFRGNSSPSGAAIGGTGGLYGQGQATIYLENCLIVGNSGGGDAVHVQGANYAGSVDMLHCTVASNANGGVRGRLYNSVPMRVRNSIVANNGGYGIYEVGTANSASMTNNDVWNNASGNYYQVTPDASSLSAEPLFINVATTNYHLRPASPCVGTAADLGLAVDLDGSPRTAPHTMGALLVQVPGTLMTEAATAIATNAATLNGVVSNVLVTPTDVTVYWGDEDGGTTGTWGNVVALTTPAFDRNNPVGPVSNAISLATQRVYYFRHSLSNSIGVNWSPATKSFLAGEVTVAKIADASEDNNQPGAFRVTRPSGAVNGAIPVNFTTNGTAAAGKNYVSIGTNTVIPDGSNFVDIVVTPIMDPLSTSDETLTLTLAAGPYVIGTPSAASMTISNYVPEDVTLTATDTAADENGPDSGSFLFTRSRTTGPLTINYTVSGTASNTDYTPALAGSITIPAGQGSTNLTIWPVPDGFTNEASETLTLALAAGTYNIASPSNGTITITNYMPVGNDVYVDLDWTQPGGGSGQSTNPFITIRAAVSFANELPHGTRGSPAIYNLRIAAGTYRDVANGGLEDYSEPCNPRFPAALSGGGYKLGYCTPDNPGTGAVVNVYGGYAGWQGGSAFDWTEVSRVKHSTIIDLQDAGARAFYNNCGTNAGVGSTGGTRFDGLTIANGSITVGESTTRGGVAILSCGGVNSYEMLYDCLISNNVAAFANSEGGGVWLATPSSGLGWIRNCEFVSNTAAYGGAFNHVNWTASCQISNTVFRGNQASAAGGAISANWGLGPIINCTFENNQASGNGGAFYGRIGPYEVKSCTFRGNNSPSGAAVGGTPGVASQGSSRTYLENCLIVGNTGAGYAVHLRGGNTPAGASNYILDMLHCTVAGNAGGGVRADDTDLNDNPMRIRNSTIANNGGYGVYRDDANDPAAELANNNVWNNTSGNYYQATPDGASISSDPKFMDSTNFHLVFGSPCRNAGAAGLGLAVDLEGNARPFNAGDRGIDMGCYEHLPPPEGTVFRFR